MIVPLSVSNVRVVYVAFEQYCKSESLNSQHSETCKQFILPYFCHFSVSVAKALNTHHRHMCHSLLVLQLENSISAEFKSIHILLISSLLRNAPCYCLIVVFLIWPMKVGRGMFFSKATMKSNVSEYLTYDANDTSDVINTCFPAHLVFKTALIHIKKLPIRQVRKCIYFPT